MDSAQILFTVKIDNIRVVKQLLSSLPGKRGKERNLVYSLE